MKPPSSFPSQPRPSEWRLNPERATDWRVWDGEMVVYDDLSGDTLHLDVVMAEVFKRLLDRPASLAELTGHLAQVLDLEITPRLEHVVETALNRLADRGLAACSPRTSTSPAPDDPPAAPSH